MQKSRWLLSRGSSVLLSLLFAPGFIHAQTSHPVFTGSWTRVSQSCQPAEKMHGSYEMMIDHQEPVLKVSVKSPVKGKMQELELTYKMNEELHYTGLDGDDFRSKPHWRGDKLVFDILEVERSKQIHTEEVWSLTESGTKLIRVKTEKGEDENSTCRSVFSKSNLNTSEKSPVKITLKTDRIVVDIDGKPFTNLYMGVEAHKPFLYPLLTASGKRVTRGFPVDPLPTDPTDHPHQKGLWVGSENLSGMDFWENDPSYHRPNMGRIVFKDVLETHTDAESGTFTMLSDWVSLEGESVLTEKRRMTFYAEPSDCRMFDVELELKAKRQVTFEDHQDSVIGMRLGPVFDEKNGGRPINAQGLVGEAQTRGQRSEWMDWQATVDGERVGVMLMDHPDNYSWPTRWHVRSMGLMVASPFAQRTYLATNPSNEKTLNAAEELHLRYRVLIHPLSTDVAAAYKRFATRQVANR